MGFMARAQASTATNPLLTFIYQTPERGFMKDVSALSYAVVDISTPAKELNPTEVVAKTSIDLVTSKLSKGRYFAPLTIGEDWDLGDYQVVWYYEYEGGDEQTLVTPLVVTDEAFGPPSYYATVQDVYDTGLSPVTYTVKNVRGALAKAHALIERWTGRVFRPQYKVHRVDGCGGMKLRLGEPIIAVERIDVEDEYVQGYLFEEEDSELHIYNRHIRYGTLAPDDRNNPHIDYSYATRPLGPLGRFSDGALDVKVTGMFGYTEPDGSPLGCTPPLVRELAVKIALLHVDGAATDDAWFAKNKWKITEERTREQSVRYGSVGSSASTFVGPGSSAFFTGDPEIDGLILSLKVGPAMMGG